MRLAGDLDLAEDAVQDACCVALERWPAEGLPGHPRAWLVGVARHKALDRLRREARRGDKEANASWPASAAAQAHRDEPVDPVDPVGDDELALIFTCCHPALDREVRLPLTLRSVAGLSTREVAAAFLIPEPTMAKRLSRAKAKIRQAGIPFRVPAPDVLPTRLADVLRVIYLVFTQGHANARGPGLVRADLCDSAIRLARRMHELIPDPETAGLLALLLLTDARRPARLDAAGEVVLLEDQDRRLWNQQMIAEGDALLQNALAKGRPGVYQLWAAIAACHSTTRTAAQTDWRQIALLYSELIRYEPTAVVEANRAVAVAMAEGPAAGLVILDTISRDPRLKRWPQIYLARADLLRRLRPAEARAVYRQALELEPAPAERAFIQRRLQ